MQKSDAPIEIDELAELFGITKGTILFYGDIDLLRPELVDGLSVYSSADRVRLELVLKGKRLGFSLAEIQRLIAERADTASAKCVEPIQARAVLSSQLATLRRQRAGLDAAIAALRSTEPGQRRSDDGDTRDGHARPTPP